MTMNTPTTRTHDDAGLLHRAAEVSPADAFRLHSLPTSTRVIYLDFDGHVMENEWWNATYSIGTTVNQPYDIDGNPSTFSDAERTRIIEIWRRVADDYAPFDVNVTTEDPGVDGLRRTSPAIRPSGRAR